MGSGQSKVKDHPRIRLFYFDSKFRAETIRMILAAGECDFEDRRVGMHEWKIMRTKTEFGHLPILEYGEGKDQIILGQSRTIARFLAKKSGLAGKNDKDEAKADMIAEHAWSLLEKFTMVFFDPTDDDKARLLDQEIPQFLETSERLLSKNKGNFFLGDEDPSDPLLEQIGGNVKSRVEGVRSKHPGLVELAARVTENKGIKKYLAAENKRRKG